MSGEFRRRASFRQQYETQRAPEQIQVQQPLTAAVPEDPFLRLAGAVPAVRGFVEQRINEQNEAERLEGIKARYQHELGEATLDEDFRTQYLGERSEAFTKAYMETHHALTASVATNDLIQFVNENMDSPGFNAEQEIDRYVSSQIQAIDDEEGIQLMARRMMPIAEQLKQAWDKRQFDRLTSDAHTNYGKLLADAATSGALGSAQDIEAALGRANALRVPQDQAKAMLVDSLVSQAINSQNPAVLEGLVQEMSDGTALIHDPRFRSKILDAAQRSQAQQEEQFNLQLMTELHALEQAAEGGQLYLDTALEHISRNPEIAREIGENRYVSLLNKARRAQQGEVRARDLTNIMMQGGLPHVPDLKPAEVDDTLRRIRQIRAEQGMDPGMITREEIGLLNDNGVVSNHYKQVLTQSARVDSRTFDGSVPDNFREAHALYREMSRYDGLAERHLTDEAARARLELYDAFLRQDGATHEQAYANMLRYTESPISEQDYAASGMRDEIENQLEDLSDYSWWWDDVRNTTEMRSVLRTSASRYARLGVDPDKAVELAGKKFAHNYKVLRGRYVYTGGHPLPENADDSLNWFLEQNSAQIRREIGDPDYDMGDIDIMPHPMDPSGRTMVAMYDGIHPITSLQVNLPQILADYQQATAVQPLTAEEAAEVSEYSQTQRQRRQEARQPGSLLHQVNSGVIMDTTGYVKIGETEVELPPVDEDEQLKQWFQQAMGGP